MYNQHEITTPAPISRTEAWAAWEAAVLSQYSKEYSKRAHLKNWTKAFEHKGTSWFLFAHKTRPNRGEVLVHPFRGGEEWINILRPYLEDKKHHWQRYKINAALYPKLAERQQAVLKGTVLTSYPWWYILGKSMEEIQTYAQTRLDPHMCAENWNQTIDRGGVRYRMPSSFDKQAIESVFRHQPPANYLDQFIRELLLQRSEVLHRLYRGQ